jgi:hypothetical protein
MSTKDRALVRHTSDRQSVEKADKAETDLALQHALDLAALLESPAGRRVLWRILTECQTFKSIWDPSSKIHYNAGKQDIGHKLMTWIMEAKPSAFTTMMEEHNEKAKELEPDA